jgi:hypothetical protein
MLMRVKGNSKYDSNIGGLNCHVIESNLDIVDA